MNLLEILKHYGVEVKEFGQHHHASKGWVNLDCPYCSPDSGRFRLGFNLERNFSCCWCCGWHPLAEALQKVTQAPWKEVLDQLGSLRGVRHHSKGVQESKVRGKLVYPAGLGKMLPPHRRYLESRGFDSEALEEVWGLKGIGIAPRLSWRVWIPISLEGEVVSWTTRAISDKAEVRYKNARPEEEKLSPKDILFGEQYVRHAIIVCEGSMDAMAIGPGAVATMGLNVSEKQLTRISRYPVRVILMDAEREAQKRARKLCSDLGVFPGDTYNVTLSGKDAASSPKEEIQQLRERFLA